MKNTFSRIFGIGEKDVQIDVENSIESAADEEKVDHEEIKKDTNRKHHSKSLSAKDGF